MEIDNLKEVVRTQQKLLHQLYTELEAEREASATAASEALSMILRLQREKASERLEASQFKRLIEEKMHHAEEVMDIFQDLMHQKEMHIASLEFQVQAYRYKMLTMGLTDSDIADSEFDSESMLLPPPQPSNASPPNNQSSPTSSPNPIPVSLSLLHRDDLPHLTLRRMSSWGSSLSQQDEEKPANKSTCDQECWSDLTSYMEQIKELDQRVKGLSSSDDTRRRRRRLSSSPSPSPKSLLLQQFDHPAPIETTESIPSTSNSTTTTRIHDIFEVPQNHNPFPPQPNKSVVVVEEKPAPGCINTSLLHHQFINNLPRHTICANCHMPLVHPPPTSTAGGLVSPFQSQFQQLSKRLEKLECERRDADRQPLSSSSSFDDDDIHKDEEKEDEKLKLLKEIHEQLNTIKSEITSTNPKKHPPSPVADQPCLVSLMEAMFFYSL